MRRLIAILLTASLLLSTVGMAAFAADAQSDITIKSQNGRLSILVDGDTAGRYAVQDDQVDVLLMVNNASGNVVARFADASGRIRTIGIGSGKDINVGLTGSYGDVTVNASMRNTPVSAGSNATVDTLTVKNSGSVTVYGEVAKVSVKGAADISIKSGADVSTVSVENSRANVSASSDTVGSVQAVPGANLSGAGMSGAPLIDLPASNDKAKPATPKPTSNNNYYTNPTTNPYYPYNFNTSHTATIHGRTTLPVNDTAQLYLNTYPSGISTSVTWSSGATNIATIDSNGWLKGIAPGTATITAYSNSPYNGTTTAYCTVTVTTAPPPSTSVVLAVGSPPSIIAGNGTLSGFDAQKSYTVRINSGVNINRYITTTTGGISSDTNPEQLNQITQITGLENGISYLVTDVTTPPAPTRCALCGGTNTAHVQCAGLVTYSCNHCPTTTAAHSTCSVNAVERWTCATCNPTSSTEHGTMSCSGSLNATAWKCDKCTPINGNHAPCVGTITAECDNAPTACTITYNNENTPAHTISNCTGSPKSNSYNCSNNCTPNETTHGQHTDAITVTAWKCTVCTSTDENTHDTACPSSNVISTTWTCTNGCTATVASHPCTAGTLSARCSSCNSTAITATHTCTGSASTTP